MKNKILKRPIIYYSILILIPIVVAILALGIGRYSISIKDVLNVLGFSFNGDEVSAIIENIVINLRIPRIIMAIFVGAGLAVAGTAMQSIFANPLATPDTIGVGSGAAFGAVLGILITDNLLLIQLLAFIMGVIATLITYFFSKISKNKNLVMIVLSGMIVSSFFSALTSLLKTLADSTTELPSIVYWLMGSFTSASYKSLAAGVPFMALGIIVLFIMRWKLNILLLSEEEIRSMGIKVNVMRAIVMGCCALITAASVSMCGQVGWIGLLAPHLSRMIVGNNNKYVVPLSISLGATFMIIVDTMARTISPTEIPLSIITALIGTPFFAYLMKRNGGTW